jgi:hypothetical protein
MAIEFFWKLDGWNSSATRSPFIILSVSTQYPFADSPFNFLSFSIELFVLSIWYPVESERKVACWFNFHSLPTRYPFTLCFPSIRDSFSLHFPLTFSFFIVSFRYPLRIQFPNLFHSVSLRFALSLAYHFLSILPSTYKIIQLSFHFPLDIRSLSLARFFLSGSREIVESYKFKSMQY